MKKLLLGLGALASVVAPVAAVVACGSSDEGNKENGGTGTDGFTDGTDGSTDGTDGSTDGTKANGGDGFVDGTAAKTQEAKSLDKAFSGEVGAFEAWALNSADIELAVTNTKTEGLITNIDFSSSFGTIVADDAVPVKTIKFTKADIIASEKNKGANKFETIARELKTLDGTKLYTGIVKTIKKDSLPANDGEFKIEIFEKAANLPLMQTAVDEFKDKTKFDFDVDMMKQLHGTYFYGASHEFVLNGGSTFAPYKIFKTDIPTKGQFSDRMENNNFKTWTMFGPLDATKDATKKSFKDGDKEISIKNAYFQKDKKTRQMSLVLKLEEKDGTGIIDTQTIYIEDPAATTTADAVKNPFSAKEFKDIFKEQFSFAPVYKFFIKLKSQAGSLPASMAPLKDVIMTQSAKINLLAKANGFITTTTFLDGFATYVSKDAIFAANLLQGMRDFKETVDHNVDFMNYGAHAWNGIQWSDELLDKLQSYIDQEVNAGNQKLSNVKNAAALNKVIQDEANKAKRVLAAKNYLDSLPSKPSYDGMTDEDILALAQTEKIKIANAGISAIPKADLDTFIENAVKANDKDASSSFSHGQISTRLKTFIKFMFSEKSLFTTETISIIASNGVKGVTTEEGFLEAATQMTGKSNLDKGIGKLIAGLKSDKDKTILQQLVDKIDDAESAKA